MKVSRRGTLALRSEVGPVTTVLATDMYRIHMVYRPHSDRHVYPGLMAVLSPDNFGFRVWRFIDTNRPDREITPHEGHRLIPGFMLDGLNRVCSELSDNNPNVGCVVKVVRETFGFGEYAEYILVTLIGFIDHSDIADPRGIVSIVTRRLGLAARNEDARNDRAELSKF